MKQDDRSHPLLGGNKVRKLALELEEARRGGCRQLLTLGGVGSNHVLATAVHGRAQGFDVTAVVVPMPAGEGLATAPKAALAAGATLIPSAVWSAPARIAAAWAALRRKGPVHWIPPGGTTVAGALGYARAVDELSQQISSGEAPFWPDTMVCAMGSGGMYAGLVAGAHDARATGTVLGVRVTDGWMVSRRELRALVRRVRQRLADEGRGGAEPDAELELELDDGQLGQGYGLATEASEEATRLFLEDGMRLDPVYTGKAAAALIARARPGERWLLWNSLGVLAPSQPTVGLPTELERLFVKRASSPRPAAAGAASAGRPAGRPGSAAT